MSERKVGRYQEKLRKGLVPAQYDRNSKSYALGARRNWPGGDGFKPEWSAHQGLLRADTAFLRLARENR
jgi:hypothetical protein